MADVKPIPDGYPRVTPYLIVDGAAAAIDFYSKVFGATERMRMPSPGGKIGHAELELGDSLIMLADEHPEMGIRGPKSIGGTPVTIQRLRRDVDAVFERAVAEGATPTRAGREPVLRRPVGSVRGPLRPPLERRHPRRGRAARRDGEAGGRGDGRDERMTNPARSADRSV